MAPTQLPIACDLAALSVEQRSNERELLAAFRAAAGVPEETDTGFRFPLPEDVALLTRLGEFLALERLCCPFLNFELLIPAGRQAVSLHIYGDPAVKSFVRSTFAG